jgi:cysteine desulfurase
MMGVYADYAAAAPLRPEARAAMLDALDAGLGNPSSAHAPGCRARARLEAAREEVAAALAVHPLEVLFTSGATEANNLALAGVVAARCAAGRIAVPTTEHASVLAPARALAARGHVVVELAVDASGRTAAADVAAARPDLLSVALVNAETGVVQDVVALAAAARAHAALVHVDAAQAPAFLPVALAVLGADLLTLSSPKLGGPAGAGALVVRRGTRLAALAHGGPQEQGRRAGSENVAAIVGFATALALAVAERGREVPRLAALHQRLRAGIVAAWPGARFTLAADVPAAPHVLSVMLPGAVGEDVVAALDLEGVAASTGSACAAGAAEPSHVLLAMGRMPAEARAALRLSVGWCSTAADVDTIVRALARVRTRVARRCEEAAWPAHAS